MSYSKILSILFYNKIPILSSLAWRMKKYLLPHAVTKVDLSFDAKMLVNPQSHMGMQLYMNGVWEKEVTEFVLNMSKKKCVIDVGAHIGYYTILFQKLMDSSGRLIAFEPHLEAKEILSSNIEIAKLDNTRLETLALAESAGISFLKSDRIVSKGAAFDCEIKTITLDKYAKDNSLTTIDLIKIDIEGFELKALKGMENILSTSKPELLIEVHPLLLIDNGQSASDLEEFIRNRGYEIQIITQLSEDNYTIFCRKSE